MSVDKNDKNDEYFSNDKFKDLDISDKLKKSIKEILKFEKMT